MGKAMRKMVNIKILKRQRHPTAKLLRTSVLAQHTWGHPHFGFAPV